MARRDVERACEGDPGWLRDRREQAWRLYEGMDLPDPGDEQWRRTDVRGLPLEGVRVATPAIAPPDSDRAPGAWLGDDGTTAASISAVDGSVVYNWLRDDLRAKGVILTDLRTAAREHEAIVRKHFGTVVRDDEWKYVALNAALWSGGVLLYVPRGVEIAEPIRITESLAVDGVAIFPRVLIVVEERASVKIVDLSTSHDSESHRAPSFVSSAVEIIAGDSARIEYYAVNRWGHNVYNFNTVRSVAGRDAEIQVMVAGLGSKLTKMRIDTEMPQPGARAQLLGITFGDGDQHFDYNTRQDHAAKHTTSDLQFKSAMTDSASLVWYGVTRIRHEAGGSEANQTSRNMLLSDHAKAAPIPVLEIEAYDVLKCSHGATAGPVDENELFYLQSRAIPRATAERMLVEGFFADIIARIPDARLGERVREAVLAKMGGTAETLTWDDVLSA